MKEKRSGRVDVGDTLAVHQAFRVEFENAADLVRSVPLGDVAQAVVVADHLEMMERFLHRHHKDEDELLWPKLYRRAPPARVDLLEVAEVQHADVDVWIARSFRLMETWRADPAERQRDELADALSKLNSRLVRHLDMEEAEILPLVPRYITDEEWRQLGTYTFNAMSRAKRRVLLGMLMHHATQEVTRRMLANQPLVSRSLLSKVAPRAYAAHMKQVYRDFARIRCPEKG
jgi:hemerythrin-like domain-containing protein